MHLSEAVTDQACAACGATVAATTVGRCPDCGEPLSLRIEVDDADRTTVVDRDAEGLARFGAVLPFPQARTVGLAAGGTPTLSLPGVADTVGIASLRLKDEGRNPSGAFADRWAAMAVTAARAVDAPAVGLASPGHSAQAVAACAAGAGLASHAFVPARAPFVTKAMINVHGGDMQVVPGRFRDARDAYEAEADPTWFAAGPFASAYPLEGAKTLAYELALQSGWSPPDALVVPVGHGLAIAGLSKGFDELARMGLVEAVPRLYAVQPSGCAPIVAARRGETPAEVSRPDTICGALEIPAPRGGSAALRAIDRTGGDAVAVPDEDILAAAVELTSAGVTAGTGGGAALAAVESLVASGDLAADEEVVCVNPLSGNKEADVLRSHLMSQGV